MLCLAASGAVRRWRRAAVLTSQLCSDTSQLRSDTLTLVWDVNFCPQSGAVSIGFRENARFFHHSLSPVQNCAPECAPVLASQLRSDTLTLVWDVNFCPQSGAVSIGFRENARFFHHSCVNFRMEVLHTAGYNCGHKLTSQKCSI